MPARGWTRTDFTRPATRTRCAPGRPRRWAAVRRTGRARARSAGTASTCAGGRAFWPPGARRAPRRASAPGPRPAPAARRRPRPPVAGPPAGRRPAHRPRRTAAALATPAQVVGDDGGAHVGHLADHRGDLVRRAVVREALPPEAKARRGRSTVHSVSPSPTASATSSTAARPRRRSGHSTMSSGSGPARAGATPPRGRASAWLSMSKCTARRSSGVRVPGVLDGPGRRHVEAVDQHHDHVAAQDRRLGRLGRARLELLGLLARTGGAAG